MRASDLSARCITLGKPHLSTATISNIETGRPAKDDPERKRRRHVTVDELVVLAAALGVTPADLLPVGGVSEPGCVITVRPGDRIVVSS